MYGVVYHCNLNLHFPDDSCCVFLFMLLLNISITVLSEVLVKIFCPFKIGLSYWVAGILYEFSNQILWMIHVLQEFWIYLIFSHYLCWSLYPRNLCFSLGFKEILPCYVLEDINSASMNFLKIYLEKSLLKVLHMPLSPPSHPHFTPSSPSPP